MSLTSLRNKAEDNPRRSQRGQRQHAQFRGETYDQRTSESNQGGPTSDSRPLSTSVLGSWQPPGGLQYRQAFKVRLQVLFIILGQDILGQEEAQGRPDDGAMSWPWSGLGARRKITKLPPKPAANPQARKRASRGDLSRTSLLYLADPWLST